jgi:uncharacterized protein (DUF433 family)
MNTVSKSLRLPEDVARELDFQAMRQKRAFASIVEEYLREAIATRRYRQVVFVGMEGDRRAHLAGSGLDVWEIALLLESVEGDVSRLRASFDATPSEQLDEALQYIQDHPEEIARRLDINRHYSDEMVRTLLPRPIARSE